MREADLEAEVGMLAAELRRVLAELVRGLLLELVFAVPGVLMSISMVGEKRRSRSGVTGSRICGDADKGSADGRRGERP